MITKLVLISNLLIYAPFAYPIGMILELAIILLCAWFLKSKIFCWIYFENNCQLFLFFSFLVDKLSVIFALCTSIIVLPNFDKVGKSSKFITLFKISFVKFDFQIITHKDGKNMRLF